jgi:hypothetical protein
MSGIFNKQLVDGYLPRLNTNHRSRTPLIVDQVVYRSN